MKIAINASDLDCSCIDGTRIYLWNCLNHFGQIDKVSDFNIYHRKKFNPQLVPVLYKNYQIKRLRSFFAWTQTSFALQLYIDQPDFLWMPMHSLPFLRPKKLVSTVTIHDLAFKYLPNHFKKNDLHKINFFTDYAVRCSDKIIAISHSTKEDILKFYPRCDPRKIRVIYHGYDARIFNPINAKEGVEKAKKKYKIDFKRYVLYVGALQPRKNIDTLIEAVRKVRLDKDYKDLGLLLAGPPAWLYENLLRKIGKNKSWIHHTGQFTTEDLPGILGGAEIFVFPSLYEGFGIPVIEAMAVGVPVILANASSLPEIAGEAAEYFSPTDSNELCEKIKSLVENENRRIRMIELGKKRVKMFDWNKCARETLEWIKT